MQWLQQFPQHAGVYYLEVHDPTFEQAYLDVRGKEERVYTDEIVRMLPRLPASHAQSKEWQYRQWSTEYFFRTADLSTSKLMLDLGCGNGWFTHQLAVRSGSQVIGLDINQLELTQAQRLFGSDRCQFAFGNVFTVALPRSSFDRITINAAVQYFPSLPDLIERLRELLSAKGQILVLDSPFYTTQELSAARERTVAYYEQRGVPEMAAYYHHHSWEAVRQLGGELLYQPGDWRARLSRRIFGRGSPFPQLVFRK